MPHWLYFTAFREQQPLWYNFIVYASLLGIFLTVTGIYVGLRMYGRWRAQVARSAGSRCGTTGLASSSASRR